QLARNVERAEVACEVELGKTIVSLRDLVALQPGDLILFDKPTDSALVAKVNERDKFHVYPGVHKDRIAVQISDVISSEDQ
ncbi:MAG TPA: FliM/FliN family flagellar motor switch protein, partial [Candidatus Baltobacteraceae bacterium]